MNVWITGGGYVTAQGWGRRSEGKRVLLAPGEPVMPRGAEIFDRPLGRYGRFDRYTRMGCAAAALALRDAGLDRADGKRPIGIVTSSLSDCFETDLAYYETTMEQGGLLSSPNLFSYTLPGILHGELAVHFLLTGPTIAIGEPPPPAGAPFRPGLPALETALRLMAAGKADAMLAGWVESPPRDKEEQPASGIAGALFVALQTRIPDANATPIVYHGAGIEYPKGRQVQSLLDFFVL